MLKSTLIGTIVAVIGVTITVFISDAVSGPLMVTSPGAAGPEKLAVGAAISGTVFGGIAGLIASGAFSFSAAEQVATGAWLNVMHVIAAIPIVGLLTRELNNRSTHTAAAG